MLAAYDGDLGAALASITDPIILSWRRSVYRDGLASPHALEAMRLITASLAQLDAALREEEWLVDGRFTLAELRCCRPSSGFSAWPWIFCGRRAIPRLPAGWRADWRPAFQQAVLDYVPQNVLDQQRAAGRAQRGPAGAS
ncbi:MAG: hypothetical protein R2838_25415 [Caldilineaceae bacterium]